MTALVLENLAALPAYAKGLRMLPMRLARGIDALVSAGAARQVPEGQTREVTDRDQSLSEYYSCRRRAARRPHRRGRRLFRRGSQAVQSPRPGLAASFM